MNSALQLIAAALGTDDLHLALLAAIVGVPVALGLVAWGLEQGNRGRRALALLRRILDGGLPRS
jgi:hypothetical protein